MTTKDSEGSSIPYLQVEGKNLPRTHDFASSPPRPLSREGTLEEKAQDSDSDSNSTASTESSDEFDWSEEENPNDDNTGNMQAKRGRRLWLAFMKLARPIRVLLVSMVGAAIFITPLVVVNIRFGDSPAKMQVHVWSLWLTIIWAAGCMTYLSVDFSPRIVIVVTGLFGGNIERLKIQVELTMAVKSWLKLALDITWAWIALPILRTIYNPPGTYWSIVNRVMQALFSAGIILFIEKLFLQFVAINFHQKALADRLAENQLGLRALDRLSNAQFLSPTKKNPYSKRGHKPSASSGTFDFSSIPYGTQKEGESSTEVSPMTGQDTPPLNESKMFSPKPSGQRKRKKKSLVTSVIVDQVGGAIGQVALKNSKFNKEGDFSGLHSARKLARKLFSALSNVNPPRSHLVVEDFYPYFRTTVEAHEAFALFDKDGNGDISKPEMREAVQRIYRERKSLIAGLKDVGSIVAKLDAVLLCLALVIVIFLCLLIFNRTNAFASLVPLATVVLGFSFIFGNSAATLFESLIFIFSTHVFDVGDLVMIDDQVLFVKEFGLFSTTFRRVDGQEVIAPNSLLANSKLVHNLRRSKSMWESTNLMVSYETPMEVIEQLRNKILTYVDTNSREWSDCALNIDKMEFQNAIHLIVAMEHRPNWQDWGGRWTRRTAFMRHLKTVLEELEIRYTMPIQPVVLPQGNASYGPAGPQMQAPPPGRPVSDSSMLGNAGFFQAGDYGRPSRPAFRDGIPSF
ncbi:Mechanosensitive ion channel-domain-containing protein [Flammula alnicola]|nr:Mechanosensitive ion channel-domain-containing protein [Flammula alnicola]